MAEDENDNSSEQLMKLVKVDFLMRMLNLRLFLV